MPSPLRIEVLSASMGTRERMMEKVRAEARMVMWVRKNSAYMINRIRAAVRRVWSMRLEVDGWRKAQW